MNFSTVFLILLMCGFRKDLFRAKRTQKQLRSQKFFRTLKKIRKKKNKKKNNEIMINILLIERIIKIILKEIKYYKIAFFNFYLLVGQVGTQTTQYVIKSSKSQASAFVLTDFWENPKLRNLKKTMHTSLLNFLSLEFSLFFAFFSTSHFGQQRVEKKNIYIIKNKIKNTMMFLFQHFDVYFQTKKSQLEG